MKKLGWIVPGLAVGLITVHSAYGSGFSLREQSASAQGTAFAGATAGAADPSHMFFNPAAVAYQSGYQLVTIGNAIAPHARAKNVRGNSITTAPLPGRDGQGEAGGLVFVPATYATAALPNGWALGLAVTVPFGLGSNYSDNWVGRYHGLKSELQTINVNPMVAWRPAEWIALGAGLQFQRAEAELSNAIDFGTLGAVNMLPGSIPGASDGYARLKGDDWGWGFNAGVLVEPGLPGLRIGASFRSEVEHELKGKSRFTLDNGGIGAVLSGLSGAFVDTGAKAKLTTPATASLGFHQEIGERWAVMGEVAWTDWSTFKELRVEFDNPSQPASITEQRWNDTWFGAIGATYALTDRWTLRGGVAFDQSPVTDMHRTPRVPDGDRYWVSVGAGYRLADWATVDAAFTYIMMDDPDVRLSTSSTGNATRGSLRADYESSIQLLALSATLRF